MQVGANSFLFYRATIRNARKRPIKVHFRNFKASDVPPGTIGTVYRRLRPSMIFGDAAAQLRKPLAESQPVIETSGSSDAQPKVSRGPRPDTLRRPFLKLRPRGPRISISVIVCDPRPASNALKMVGLRTRS